MDTADVVLRLQWIKDVRHQAEQDRAELNKL